MQEFLHGAWAFVICILPPAAIVFTARRLIRIPDELFRKILHFLMLLIYIPLLFAMETWWLAVLLAGVLIVILYPILALLVRLPGFTAFANERKRGEFKSSMAQALLMVMVSITVCWGLLGDKLLVLACVYAWGVGDAFAALIGKQFGRHKVRLPHADPHKSWEGSAAMFTASLLTVLTILLIRGGLTFPACLLVAVIGAAITAYVELCSTGGMDTVTCPLAAMAVILPLIKLLGG